MGAGIPTDREGGVLPAPKSQIQLVIFDLARIAGAQAEPAIRGRQGPSLPVVRWAASRGAAVFAPTYRFAIEHDLLAACLIARL